MALLTLYVVWNASLTTATTYAYVNPVVALLLGWAIVDETVSALILVGAALIVASLAVVLRSEACSRQDVR